MLNPFHVVECSYESDSNGCSTTIVNGDCESDLSENFSNVDAMDPLAAPEIGSVVAEGAATNHVVQTPNVSTLENTEFNDTRLEAIDPIADGSADGVGVANFHKADGTGASTS